MLKQSFAKTSSKIMAGSLILASLASCAQRAAPVTTGPMVGSTFPLVPGQPIAPGTRAGFDSYSCQQQKQVIETGVNNDKGIAQSSYAKYQPVNQEIMSAILKELDQQDVTKKITKIGLLIEKFGLDRLLKKGVARKQLQNVHESLLTIVTEALNANQQSKQDITCSLSQAPFDASAVSAEDAAADEKTIVEAPKPAAVGSASTLAAGPESSDLSAASAVEAGNYPLSEVDLEMTCDIGSTKAGPDAQPIIRYVAYDPSVKSAVLSINYPYITDSQVIFHDQRFKLELPVVAWYKFNKDSAIKYNGSKTGVKTFAIRNTANPSQAFTWFRNKDRDFKLDVFKALSSSDSTSKRPRDWKRESPLSPRGDSGLFAFMPSLARR